MAFAKGTSGNPLGPRKKTLTEAQLKLIATLAGEGKRERWIAFALGVTPPTWRRLKREHVEVMDALEYGKEALYNTIVGRLLDQSKRGNIVASIYLSKVLLGLRENEPPADSRPIVNINLPGAVKTIEEYRGQTFDNAPPLTLEKRRG